MSKRGRQIVPIKIKHEGSCHICISHKWCNKKGYNRIERDGKTTTMSRYIYEKSVGKIPEGQMIRHTCDNPKCINPKHLLPGTAKDNMNDMIRRRRNRTGIDHSSSKLTEEQVLNIFKSNEGPRALGREYNISHSVIVRIKQGKKWKRLLQDNNLIPKGVEL